MICDRLSSWRTSQALTVNSVGLGLQSAPESPPVSKQLRHIYAAMFLVFWCPVTLTFRLFCFKLKIGTSLTRALENVYANYDFLSFFVFDLRAHTGGTDRQTNAKTDREYLRNGTSHRQSENVVANCVHSRTGKLNLVYLGLQTAKIWPEFWATHWAAIRLGIGNHIGNHLSPGVCFSIYSFAYFLWFCLVAAFFIFFLNFISSSFYTCTFVTCK